MKSLGGGSSVFAPTSCLSAPSASAPLLSASPALLCTSVAGVASPLCVNSALIQKLFYAVKRTCDRQREGEEAREEEEEKGGARQHFLVTCPLGHVQNNF